ELNQIDPTTGIGGIKIDGIENFGKDPEFTSFQVEFTFCPNQDCGEIETSLIPTVAYKAGQCVYNVSPPEIEQKEEPSDLSVSINKIDPSCNNSSGGSIELIIEGTAPYEIIWNTGQTEITIQNLTAGLYSYTISDASEKQVEGEVILENPALFSIDATMAHPDCLGVNSGSIDIGIEGGTAPYTFLWSNGSSNQNLTNLYAGTYIVQVTDAAGCSAEKTISLINSTSIKVDAKVTQPSCQEGTSGSIALSVTGGTEPYAFSWSNNMESATIDGLSDGYYRVTITDQNGCSYSKTYSIITDTGITAFASVTKTNCFDDPIGEIDLTISGGTEPYTIVWSNESTTEDIDGLIAGNYTATITDALGCQIIYKTSVTKDDIIINYESVSIPTCSGTEDGAINISISNGTEPYNYIWSNSSNEEDISDLSAGKYTVEVTDAKGCAAEKTFNL
ncbi:MAG: SprB repeat-containing protein, partial [Cyclobacteriaceae bacterium]|nr:SprB repeat-containing protein [Cyclobacteriaceae bacterium]